MKISVCFLAVFQRSQAQEAQRGMDVKGEREGKFQTLKSCQMGLSSGLSILGPIQHHLLPSVEWALGDLFFL